MNAAPVSTLRSFVFSFTDLIKCPRAFWFVLGAFVVESMAYFGVLTLMTTHLSSDLGWGDRWAGMMIVGTPVSAAPTSLLCGGPNLTMLIAYFTVFSIGEALWSARFLEYASELAPPGCIAQYTGLANIPWLLAKGTTGHYSGWMLAT